MIVVTGGAGFIGSNLVAGLEARGERDIVVCDRLGTGEKWRNLAKREIADLIDPAALGGFLDRHAGRVRAVLHMGAISATTETDLDRLVACNLRPTLDLWAWCAENLTPFVYASSGSVYGSGEHGFDDGADPGPLVPLNGYAWSKLAADRRFLRLARSGARRPPHWAGLRFFNVYGPNEYHKGGMRSVALQIFERAAAGEPARLYRSHRPDVADGEQRRDFVDVDDCVQAMLWLLDHPGVSGVFNVGSGRARSFRELAEAVFAALDLPPRIAYVDMPPAMRARYQYRTEARMDRLRDAGYTRPATPLEEGVGRYVRDFLRTADPYR